MAVSLTYLRAHLYQVVDRILESGVPVDITRHGHTLKIVAIDTKDKVGRLKKHAHVVVGNSDDLVHFDWSSYWHEDKKL